MMIADCFDCGLSIGQCRLPIADWSRRSQGVRGIIDRGRGGRIGPAMTPATRSYNGGMDDRERRVQMVEHQIAARGVRDPRVLEALREVPRHSFVPDDQRAHSYEDRALPIASGQTISQPYIVAIMTELLGPEPHHRVLEIGTGSGYQTAILAQLSTHVISIERHPELARSAEEVLATAGLVNVDIRVGDGSEGLPEDAPFDRILVTAGAPAIPE